MGIRSFVQLVLAASMVGPLFASSALAGPTDPVTVVPAPEGQGAIFSPGVRLVQNLPEEYVEEEFFVSGTASVYNYNNDPPLGPTDYSEIQTDVPYTTRIIVRRPAAVNKVNGTVVVEWWNSTAGFDSAPSWDPSAEYFATEGITYVGVTNSATSIAHLVGGCATFGQPPECGTRYAGLSLPENGMAYDIVNQLTNLLKSNDANNPLPEGYVPDIVLHVGESQQAGSVITFASGFHTPGLGDGYFIQSNIGARSINAGPRCGADGSPPFPDCTPVLLDRRVSTNLPAPVYQTVTQTDFEGLNFNIFGRQSDTSTFRYYEITGAAHSTVHIGIEIIPGVTLEDLCLEQLNTVADGPVFGSYVINALWERMQEQILEGAVPPAGVVMDTLPGSPPVELARDGNGNVLGGVRLPSIEVPTATYVSEASVNPFLPPQLQFIGGLVCRLSGAVVPFDQATLDTLYRNHGKYVSAVAAAAKDLKTQGLLLQRNASAIKRAAATSAIGR